MRLDKFLAEGSIGQRKQVRSFIKQGKVTVNDIIITEPYLEMDELNDVVRFEGELIRVSPKRYYMFHKPAGCITARKDDRHKTVLDYFSESERPGLFPVGRLDKDTEGLLLLTNDGEFDYKMMDPLHHVEKTYFFWALGTITESSERQLEEGIDIGLEQGISKPAKLTLDRCGYYDQYADLIDPMKTTMKPTINPTVYRKPVVSGYLTITEGKKHQVKRMLRAVGCYVIYLKRISIGNLELDPDLKPGEYRVLTKSELKNL